jgi:hypothetical protein
MNQNSLDLAIYLRRTSALSDSAIVRAARAAAPHVAEISRLSVIPETWVPALRARDLPDPAG